MFKRVNFREEQFRGRTTIRLNELRHLIATGAINAELRIS